MTEVELKKLPKSISNKAIDDRCTKLCLSADAKWAYKKGMKEMREIMWEMVKEMENELNAIGNDFTHLSNNGA